MRSFLLLGLVGTVLSGYKPKEAPSYKEVPEYKEAPKYEEPAKYNPYLPVAPTYLPAAPTYLPVVPSYPQPELYSSQIPYLPQNPYAGYNIAAFYGLGPFAQQPSFVNSATGWNPGFAAANSATGWNPGFAAANGVAGVNAAANNDAALNGAVADSSSGMNTDASDVLSAPLVTFGGSGTGQFDGTGISGFVGQGQAGFNGQGAGVFFGNGISNFNGQGNVNVVNTPMGAVGTFAGDSNTNFAGNGGLFAVGQGQGRFAGNGWGFSQGVGNFQVEGAGNVRVGDNNLVPNQNQIFDLRRPRTVPLSGQSQALLNPLNQFVSNKLLNTQNLITGTLARINDVQQISIRNSQQMINGLFNSLRNTNTFMPGGGNKPVLP